MPRKPPKAEVGGTKRLYLPQPLPHQLPVLLSRARFKVVVCGRRWGKTTAGLMAVVEGHGPRQGGFKGALDGGHVWWIAPTFGQAGQIWRDLKAALRECWADKSEVERRIELPTGGSVTVKSADQHDSLRGAALDGVVLDEAAHMIRLRELWQEVLRPMLSDRTGWGVFISTPAGLAAKSEVDGGKASYFYEIFQAAPKTEGWQRWQQPTTENPRIRPEEIEVARRELHSLAFAQEYLAEFVDAGGGLLKREWIKRYQTVSPGVYRLHDGLILRLEDLRRYGAADLAISLKTTADYTALAVIGECPDGRRLLLDVKRARLTGPEIPEFIGGAVSEWGLAAVGVESVGFQMDIVQRTRELGLPVFECLPDKDKVARFLPAAADVQGGRLLLPLEASWLPEAEQEMLSFPQAPHDDMVDAVSYATALGKSFAASAWWERGEPTPTAKPMATDSDTPPPSIASTPASPLDGLMLGGRPW